MDFLSRRIQYKISSSLHLFLPLFVFLFFYSSLFSHSLSSDLAYIYYAFLFKSLFLVNFFSYFSFFISVFFFLTCNWLMIVLNSLFLSFYLSLCLYFPFPYAGNSMSNKYSIYPSISHMVIRAPGYTLV